MYNSELCSYLLRNHYINWSENDNSIANGRFGFQKIADAIFILHSIIQQAIAVQNANGVSGERLLYVLPYFI